MSSSRTHEQQEERARLVVEPATRSYGSTAQAEAGTNPDLGQDDLGDLEAQVPPGFGFLDTPEDLFPLAKAVLGLAQSDGLGRMPKVRDDGSFLPVLLFVAWMNDLDRRGLVRDGRKMGGRERYGLQKQVEKVRSRLEGRIWGHLDDGMEVGQDEEEEDGALTGQGGPAGGGGDDGLDEDVEREVEEIIWTKWTFGSRDLCAIDLLLPPYTSSPSPFLSHPLLRHALDHAWDHGLPLKFGTSKLSRLERVRTALHSYITPPRTHLLGLISHLVLLGLTLTLAISPRGWLTPYPDAETGTNRPDVLEWLYIVWACSSFLSALRSPLRTPLLLPTSLVPPLSLLSNSTSFTLLPLSILPLTLLLILPSPPSLLPLLADGLPLGITLTHLFSRSLRSARLFLPLVFLGFMLLAWSMDGDIFRGFLTLPLDLQVPGMGGGNTSTGPDHALPGGIDIAMAGLTTGEETPGPVPVPVEPGIAPYQTRLVLFLTTLLLFVLGTTVSLVRILTPVQAPSPSHHTPSSHYTHNNATPSSQHTHNNAAYAPTISIHQDDPWIIEFGLIVGLGARERQAMIVRDAIYRREIVSPLNVFIALICPVRPVLHVVGLVARWRTAPTIDHWVKTLTRWDENVWLFVMGGLCFPLYLLDRIVQGFRGHQ